MEGKNKQTRNFIRETIKILCSPPERKKLSDSRKSNIQLLAIQVRKGGKSEYILRTLDGKKRREEISLRGLLPPSIFPLPPGVRSIFRIMLRGRRHVSGETMMTRKLRTYSLEHSVYYVHVRTCVNCGRASKGVDLVFVCVATWVGWGSREKRAFLKTTVIAQFGCAKSRPLKYSLPRCGDFLNEPPPYLAIAIATNQRRDPRDAS